MEKLILSIVIGAAAGFLDVIPMVLQKMDPHANYSAFVHWVVLGIFIAYIQFPVAPWLKGLIVAELAAVPVVIMVSKDDSKAIIPILASSAILGIIVGILTAKIIG